MKLYLTGFVLTIISCLAFKIAAQQCKSRYEPFFNGTCMPPGDCTGAIINNKCPEKLKCCIPENDTINSMPIFVTKSELENILSLKNSRIEYISKVLIGPSSTNPTCFQKAFYLSQLAHESSNFMESEELGSDSSFNANYDGVNGNKNPGDGAKYKGRGFIQLTGRSNYQKAGRDLGIDLENQPELAAFPSIASKIARWFWQFGTKENLNTFSDGTFYGFSRITSLINGGLNGFKERVELLETAAKTLQCGELMKGRGENCTINGKQGVCKPICNVGMVGKKFCGCNGKTVANQCQGPANIRCCDEKCSNNMDLTFVLDSSGSVGPIDFERAKTFVGQFVDKLEISPNKTQVALVKYATSVDIENYLNSTNSKKPLLTFISRITYTGGSTATGDALNACFDIYSPTKGMRNSSTGVSKVIVVLTDGRSNTGRQPIPVADALKAQKISIISVGVGQNLNLNELNGISSRNRFYRANDYNQVSLIYDELNQVSCLQPAIIPNNTAPIEVDKDTFKYFTYNIQNFNSTLAVYININILFGDVRLFSSLTNENPNDYEVLDLSNTNIRSINVKEDQNLLELDSKSNYSQVYIGVKGLMDYNQFSIEINELKEVPSYNYSNKLKSTIFLTCIISLISYFI